MKPLVTIIVPVYNVEKYICGCVTSIFEQTYENLQVILVDDGTPDNSGKICDEFAKKDDRVLVIHKENGGLSSARNAGLDVAKGDYIMFVDSDDYIVDNAVEILVKANEEHGADFVQFCMIHTDKQEYSVQHADEEYNEELLADTRQMYWKMYNTVGAGESACTKLYKKELLHGLRFKEGIIHEDTHFNLRMIQKAKRALYLDTGLYYYVLRQNSIITAPFSKKNLDGLWVSEFRINEFDRLGFDDLKNREKENYFFKLANFWCLAKKAKEKECLGIIENKICEFEREDGVCFNKKAELIYRISRKSVKLLYIYYLYKKISGQI